jgi:chromosome segregation ATPase
MVTNEIDTIRNSFAKGAEDLARLQSMLDIGNLEDMSAVVSRYEDQVAEAERQRTEAAEGARRYSEELEKEKERLIKLWDAYKNQEEELSSTEKRIAQYEEQARMAESSKKQLEDDLTARINLLTNKIEENEEKIQKFDEYKNRVDEFDTVRNRLDGEIYLLKEEINNKNTTITTLEKQVTESKEYEKNSEYKTRYEDLNAEYEKEKERLTKLYQLYEETDAECKRLKDDNHNWQKWFNSNREIFDKLFSAAPTYRPNEAPFTQAPEDTTAFNPEDSRPDEITKRKKMRFRK